MTINLIKKAEFDKEGKPTLYSFFVVYHVESKQYILKRWSPDGEGIVILISNDKDKMLKEHKEQVQYYKTLAKAKGGV